MRCKIQVIIKNTRANISLQAKKMVGLGCVNWRLFEPHPKIIASIVTVFDGSTLPSEATAERTLRLCA